uniref:Uncharacterized protein n=1 Tax=Lygus hesperus TaxID=30085 RepID=A0A146KU09_LYGHE
MAVYPQKSKTDEVVIMKDSTKGPPYRREYPATRNQGTIKVGTSSFLTSEMAVHPQQNEFHQISPLQTQKRIRSADQHSTKRSGTRNHPEVIHAEHPCMDQQRV